MSKINEIESVIKHSKNNKEITWNNQIDFSTQYYHPDTLRRVVLETFGYNSIEDFINWINNKDNFVIAMNGTIIQETLNNNSYSKHENRKADYKKAELIRTLNYSIYKLDKYSLDQYFNERDLLIEKIEKMLYFTESISKKLHQSVLVLNVFEDYKIELDHKGNIKREDIHFIISYLKYYINKLNVLLEIANDKNSYLSNKIELPIPEAKIINYDNEPISIEDEIEMFSLNR